MGPACQGNAVAGARPARQPGRIADGGRDAFYGGETADIIDAYFRAQKGFLRKEDLAAHRGEWVEPVSTNYRGVDV